MTIHKPTLIRAIRSVLSSTLGDEQKGQLIQHIVEDAHAHDPTVDPDKVLRGAGFTPSRVVDQATRH